MGRKIHPEIRNSNSAEIFSSISHRKMRICMIFCLYFQSKHDKLRHRGSGCITALLLLCCLKTVIFQQMREKTTRFIMLLSAVLQKCDWRNCVFKSCRAHLGIAQPVLGQTSHAESVIVRFGAECFQAGWVSQRKLGNRYTTK